MSPVNNTYVPAVCATCVDLELSNEIRNSTMSREHQSWYRYIKTGEIKSMLCHTCICIIPMCVLVYYSHGSVLYSTPHPGEGCTERRSAVTHNTQTMH